MSKDSLLMRVPCDEALHEPVPIIGHSGCGMLVFSGKAKETALAKGVAKQQLLNSV